MVAVPSSAGDFGAGGAPRETALPPAARVGLQVGVRGGAVAGQQIEQRQAARDGGGARRIAAIAERGEEFAVGLARAGIAVAVQEFGIRGPGGHAVGVGLGGAGERSARAQGVARGFHLLNRIEALFSEDRRGSGR